MIKIIFSMLIATSFAFAASQEKLDGAEKARTTIGSILEGYTQEEGWFCHHTVTDGNLSARVNRLIESRRKDGVTDLKWLISYVDDETVSPLGSVILVSIKGYRKK